jgi:hypothetical protein
VVALVSPQRPPGARADLKRSFALLVSALVLLGAIVTFLVARSGSALTASNQSAARYLVVFAGLVTGVLAYLTARRFLRRSHQLSWPRLTLDRKGVRLDDLPGAHEPVPSSSPAASAEPLIDFSQPFGMTLLGNRKRDRIVLAITTAHRAVYFGARLDIDERRAYAAFVSQASTVSDDDGVLDAAGPNGNALEVEVRDLRDLTTALLRADRQSFDRCFLSDTHGAPVVLDGPALSIGASTFDLRAPLEWRATLFQEPTGAQMPVSDWDARLSPSPGVMVFQATWIRQGSSEAVLVSLLASLSAAAHAEKPAAGEEPEIIAAVLRDIRLMQASPDAPPPAELRVGIERMFMLRLRAALDGAPRPSRKSVPTSVTR